MISTLSTALSLSVSSERNFVLQNAVLKWNTACTWIFLCNSRFSETWNLSTSGLRAIHVTTITKFPVLGCPMFGSIDPSVKFSQPPIPRYLWSLKATPNMKFSRSALMTAINVTTISAAALFVNRWRRYRLSSP